MHQEPPGTRQRTAALPGSKWTPSSPRISGHVNVPTFEEAELARIGREETRLGQALRAREIEVVAQYRVNNTEGGPGHYCIDLAAWPLAIEVYTWYQEPDEQERLRDRAVWLLRQGWYVAYLWLRNGEDFNNEAVDALVSYHEEASGGSPERFRIYLADGELYRRGDLGMLWYLDVDRLSIHRRVTARHREPKRLVPPRFNVPGGDSDDDDEDEFYTPHRFVPESERKPPTIEMPGHPPSKL